MLISRAVTAFFRVETSHRLFFFLKKRTNSYFVSVTAKNKFAEIALDFPSKVHVHKSTSARWADIIGHAITDFLLRNDDKKRGSKKTCPITMARVPIASISSRRAAKDYKANKRTKLPPRCPEDRLSSKNRCWKRARDLLLLYILASLSQFGFI